MELRIFLGDSVGDFIGNLEGNYVFLGLFFGPLWAYFVYTLKECSGSFEDVSVNTTDYGRPVSRGLYQVKAY